MKPRYVVIAFLYFSAIQCATFNHLKKYPNFEKLGEKEKKILNRIDKKLVSHPNKEYYYSRLRDLLLVPQKTIKINKLAKKQKKDLKVSVKNESQKATVKNPTPKSSLINYGWVKVFPFGKNGPYFYLWANNPLDIKVKINIYVDTDTETQQKIYSLESAIEDHVARKGFEVDITFVSAEYEEIQSTFTVKSNHGEWATAINWVGGKNTMAHELMHLLGLDDEYNKIEMHYDNDAMPWEQRLLIFLYGIDQEIPEDAEDGIMVYGTLKPLQRHVCAIAKLGDSCTELRTKVYGKWN